MAKLKEVCTFFADGDWIESSDQSDEGIRLIQTGNIGEGKYLEKETRAKYISESTFNKLSCTEVYPGDILVSRLPEPVGRACIIPEKNERMITAVDCTICRPNETLISKEYMCYFMRSNVYHTRLLGSVTGTTRKRISRKNLGNVEVKIPPKGEQNAIVKQLDCLTSVISLRSRELELLDELVRGRFVELFGECRKRVFLNDLCSIITDGTHQPPKFQSDGVPFIFVSNLARNIITYDTEKYISAETYLELYKRTPIEIGDVLLSTVGSYGHPAVVTEAKKFLFQRHIAYLKPKHDIVNSFFLHSALLSLDGQRQIKEKVKGIAQKTLNLSEIRKIEIPLPELQKQNQFADFVHQIDKSKLIVQKELDETQLLFDSLMQEYFG